MANSTAKTSKSKKKISKKVAKKPAKTAKKAAARKKTVRKTTNKKVAPALRQKMIEETAYFNAQQRGFISNNALDDWLAAEREVDKKISKQ